MILLIEYVSGSLDESAIAYFSNIITVKQQRKKKKNIQRSGDGKSAKAKLKMSINCSFVRWFHSIEANSASTNISFYTHIYLLRIIFIHFI